MKNNNIEFRPYIEIVSYNLVVEFIKDELKNNTLSYVASKFVDIIMKDVKN